MEVQDLKSMLYRATHTSWQASSQGTPLMLPIQNSKDEQMRSRNILFFVIESRSMIFALTLAILSTPCFGKSICPPPISQFRDANKLYHQIMFVGPEESREPRTTYNTKKLPALDLKSVQRF